MFAAMMSNLFLLPSMLLSFGKKGTTKAFEDEPVIELLEVDEEEDGEDAKIKELEKELSNS